MSKPITRRSLALLIGVYLTTDPTKKAPIIRQRFFTLDNDNPSFMGRTCAAWCRTCAAWCRTCVYYYCRACQCSDRPSHNAVCDAAKGKQC